MNKHNVAFHHANNEPNYWNNQTREAWDWEDKAGYVGRVLFQGEAGTVLSVSNQGPLPTHSNRHGHAPDTSKFYWTQVASGGKASTDWSEYFIVLRPKGFTHNEAQVDGPYYGKNIVVQHTGGTFTIPYGAGPSEEKATSGQIGYDGDGNPGTYNGSNEFEYKYPYRVIFIDVTFLPYKVGRTDRINQGTQARDQSTNWTVERGILLTKYYSPQPAFYETNVLFSTSDGASLPLMLQTRYETQELPPENPACIFAVRELLSVPLPYATLRQSHTSISTAIDVAELSYASPSCQAVITITSSPSAPFGTEFGFRADAHSPIVIPHQLVYTCTTGAAGDCNEPILITSDSRSFYTFHDEVGPPSPIEGTLGAGHYLEGTLSLFVDPNIDPPLPGQYRSYVYILVERYQ